MHINSTHIWLRALSCAAILITIASPAQTYAGAPVSSEPAPSLIADETPLPDSPGFSLRQPQFTEPPVQPQDPPANGPAPVAKLRIKRIPAGYAYHHLDDADKVYIGQRDTYSFGDIAEWFLASGWSQLRGGQPHYGVDRGAYGQRLAASAFNETAEGILGDSVFAIAFHEDPRYFVEGPNHDLLHRTTHAVSRVFITRNDNGTHGPNFALLSSYATVHAIDLSFYPAEDRTARRYFAGFGYSLCGGALGYAFDEFVDDALVAIHLKKKP